MWEKIELPNVPAPITAVSIPHESDYCVAWTDEGLYRVRLSTRPHVSRLMSVDRAKQKFHSDTGSVEITNTVRPVLATMHGRCSDLGTFRNERLTETHALGDRVEREAGRGDVRVVDVTGRVVLTIPILRADGPLDLAGFCSGVKDYFLACDGVAFHAYRYRRDREGVATPFRAYEGEPRDSLLRACFDCPDNDVPRLVFADWLDEHGDPDRARFVRLQCRLAERRRKGFVPPDDPDAAAEAALLAAHGRRWAAECPRPVGIEFRAVEFYRGFPVPELVSPVKASTNACRTKLAANLPLDALAYSYFQRPRETGPFWAWDAFPRVRSLSLHGAYDATLPSFARLLRLPALSGVRHVHVKGWHTAPVSAALAEGPVGATVESLTFHECMFDEDRDDSLGPLAEGTRLPNLASITFVGSFNDGIERTAVVRRLAKTYGAVYRITDDRRWKRVTPER